MAICKKIINKRMRRFWASMYAISFNVCAWYSLTVSLQDTKAWLVTGPIILLTTWQSVLATQAWIYADE